MTLFATELALTAVLQYIFSHNFAKIKVDSYDSLPIERNIDFA